MFQAIWEERPHLSEISGRPLHPIGHWQWHWQFAHVLSKGTYGKYRLNPDNIMLMLPEEHESQESYEVFQERKIKLKREYNDRYKT